MKITLVDWAAVPAETLLRCIQSNPLRRYTGQKPRHCTYYGLTEKGLAASPPAMEPMTPAEEQKLFRRVKSDPAAREKLVRRYLCFAFGMAARYRGRLDFDEAVGAANEGLMEALGTFEPARGNKFIVYSYKIIYRHVVKALVNTYPVRVPERMCKNLCNGRMKLRAIVDAGELKRESLDGDMELTTEEFFRRLSEDTRFSEAVTLFERPEDCDFMPAEEASPADGAAARSTIAEMLRLCDTALDANEREILRARYLQEVPEPFYRICKRLKIYKDTARDMHDLALVKLRRRLQAERTATGAP